MEEIATIIQLTAGDNPTPTGIVLSMVLVVILRLFSKDLLARWAANLSSTIKLLSNKQKLAHELEHTKLRHNKEIEELEQSQEDAIERLTIESSIMKEQYPYQLLTQVLTRLLDNLDKLIENRIDSDDLRQELKEIKTALKQPEKEKEEIPKDSGASIE